MKTKNTHTLVKNNVNYPGENSNNVHIDPYLSRAALLLSRNSTEDGSSIPTFTFVIPVDPDYSYH